MKGLLFLALILSSACVYGQYKNMSVGVHYATIDFKSKLQTGAIDFQYNTKNTVSFRTGCYVDYSHHEENTNFKIYNYDAGQYQSFIRTDKIENWH